MDGETISSAIRDWELDRMSTFGAMVSSFTFGIESEKMKAYWEFRCDEGHVWTILRDIDELENPDDGVCPFGHDAVTLHKAMLLDMVQIAIRPAARVVDDVTERTGREYEYYLVIADLHRDVERMSRRTWSWNDAKAAMDRFRLRPDQPGTVSADRAWQILSELDSVG